MKIHFQSKEAAWIYSGNEFSQILLLFFLPFFVHLKRRPLWLGLVTILAGLGTLLIAVPNYTATRETTTELNVTRRGTQFCNRDVQQQKDEECGEDQEYNSPNLSPHCRVLILNFVSMPSPIFSLVISFALFGVILFKGWTKGLGKPWRHVFWHFPAWLQRRHVLVFWNAIH
jgi:hypothetical protein